MSRDSVDYLLKEIVKKFRMKFSEDETKDLYDELDWIPANPNFFQSVLEEVHQLSLTKRGFLVPFDVIKAADSAAERAWDSGHRDYLEDKS